MPLMAPCEISSTIQSSPESNGRCISAVEHMILAPHAQEIMSNTSSCEKGCSENQMILCDKKNDSGTRPESQEHDQS